MLLYIVYFGVFVVCVGSTRPYFKVKQLSVVTDPLITEVSGIAASRVHTDILYVHNDSGDGPFIYAINAITGEVQSKISINKAINNDWEDIAYGVCHGQEYCLFIGDFGGNSWNGSRDVIYRVREPAVINQTLTVDIDATIHFSWTEQNCEIIMVDPKGDIYLVSKTTGVPAKAVYVPSSAWNNPDITNLTDLVSMSFHTEHPDPTGGDISPNGTEMVIISVDNLYYWNVTDGDFLSALVSDPINLKYKDEPKGEAVCWKPDGSGFYTLSEGLNQPIYYYERLTGDPTGSSNRIIVDFTCVMTVLLSVAMI
ncbi:uncharacterized protein LOC127729270 [Mytilus californianus]|uniref:uncharacterized protein LOC127729270 n=1 Tax=Mytilus californianus TaxID=6549 RepID=UPI002245C7DA|nr:uncharacterized protein LOC127729270 [Mytilus californianus]